MADPLTEQTVRQVEPVLLGFARRAVRDEALARDLVQETFRSLKRTVEVLRSMREDR